jgi:hypothetical protein
MKDYLRVTTSDDDALIDDFVSSATEQVKQYIRRSLITETLKLTMDGFGDNADIDARLDSLGAGVHTVSRNYILGRPHEVDLPFLPIQVINSVTTYDRSNNSSVFSSSKYELDETGGRLYLNEGETWPDNLRSREAVEINYDAGYGDSPSDVPAPIVQAVKQQVGKMYDCREACELSDACKGILAPYKIMDNLAY